LYIDVEYNPNKTDPDSLAWASDTLMETVLSTPGVLGEYGKVRFGKFYVQTEILKQLPGPKKSDEASMMHWQSCEETEMEPAEGDHEFRQLVLFEYENTGSYVMEFRSSKPVTEDQVAEYARINGGFDATKDSFSFVSITGPVVFGGTDADNGKDVEGSDDAE